MDRIIKGYVKDFSKKFGLEFEENKISDLFENFMFNIKQTYK